MPSKAQILAKIASRHLNIHTLEVRNQDRLDFHEVSVAGVIEALEAAYAAGQGQAAAATKPHARAKLRPIKS